MKSNQTEDTLNSINQNVFFREFTFIKNDFIVYKNKLEFSDNLVCLDTYQKFIAQAANHMTLILRLYLF